MVMGAGVVRRGSGGERVPRLLGVDLAGGATRRRGLCRRGRRAGVVGADEQAAMIGARLMIFSQQTWETFAEGSLKQYRETYRKHHGGDPPPPLTGELMFCHEDPQGAEELAMEYMPNYFLTIIDHYEIMSDHFKTAKGYEFYASSSDLFKEVGLENAAKGYCQVQTFGTPEQILEKLRWRRELLGDFEINLIGNYGGMPFEEAEKSVSLFARKVLPELQRW